MVLKPWTGNMVTAKAEVEFQNHFAKDGESNVPASGILDFALPIEHTKLQAFSQISWQNHILNHQKASEKGSSLQSMPNSILKLREVNTDICDPGRISLLGNHAEGVGDSERCDPYNVMSFCGGITIEGNP
jgi:hypothetical protein